MKLFSLTTTTTATTATATEKKYSKNERNNYVPECVQWIFNNQRQYDCCFFQFCDKKNCETMQSFITVYSRCIYCAVALKSRQNETKLSHTLWNQKTIHKTISIQCLVNFITFHLIWCACASTIDVFRLDCMQHKIIATLC